MIDLCRDRACTQIIETVQTVGSVAMPTQPLPPMSVVYWRARSRNAGGIDAALSATWLFHLPAVSASMNRSTTSTLHLDLDGDGLDDIAAGEPHAMQAGRTDLGSVVILAGRAGAAPQPARILYGELSGDLFGHSVSGAGDINGDGYADLLVGAPNATRGGRRNAGRVFVFMGSALGVSMSPTFALDGGLDGDVYGRVVAGVGDVNRDGYSDVVVGAPLRDVGVIADVGAVYLYLGSHLGLSSVASKVFNGTSRGDEFGDALKSAGDFNGDGFADLAIGTYLASPMGRVSAGTVSIYFGSDIGLSSSSAITVLGSAMGDKLGWALAGADVNNDGFGDVAIGAIGTTIAGIANAGTLSVLFGAAMGFRGPVRVRGGNAANDAVGFALSAGSDLNGDGFADLCMGTPRAMIGGAPARGSVQLLLGSVDGTQSTPARVIEGANVGDQFGFSVSCAGNVNGDTFDDLVIGANTADPQNRPDAGIAVVYTGARLGVSLNPILTVEGSVDGAFLGWSLARLSLPNLQPQSRPAWSLVFARELLSLHPRDRTFCLSQRCRI
jgi:hypothetical protein